MPDMMHHLMAEHGWALYLCLAIAPFIQEDAATLAAASLAASGMGDPALIFAVFLISLSISDMWKYWVGRLAHRMSWARRWAADPRVEKARSALQGSLARTLFTVRFIPGLRIATYIAAGYVRIAFLPFALLIVASAALLFMVVFAAFWTLGAAFGETIQAWLPVIGFGILTLILSLTIGRRMVMQRRQGA